MIASTEITSDGETTVLVTKRVKNQLFQFFYNISTIEHARAMHITFLEPACISESYHMKKLTSRDLFVFL